MSCMQILLAACVQQTCITVHITDYIPPQKTATYTKITGRYKLNWNSKSTFVPRYQSRDEKEEIKLNSKVRKALPINNMTLEQVKKTGGRQSSRYAGYPCESSQVAVFCWAPLCTSKDCLVKSAQCYAPLRTGRTLRRARRTPLVVS